MPELKEIGSQACVPNCYAREVRASTDGVTMSWVLVVSHRRISIHVRLLERRANGRLSFRELLGEGHQGTTQLNSPGSVVAGDDASVKFEVLMRPQEVESSMRGCR